MNAARRFIFRYGEVDGEEVLVMIQFQFLIFITIQIELFLVAVQQT